MPYPFRYNKAVFQFTFLAFFSFPISFASAATCTTQSQMTPAQRDALSGSARMIATELQTGDIDGLRANTNPAVATNFAAITSSVQNLKPVIQSATITIEELYILDSSADPTGTAQSDFYCGQPVVSMNITNLSPGHYALAILHATGVLQPQQISLILSNASGNRWMLAGYFTKPMIAAGHDGIWYWSSARKYAQTKMTWNAWLYYRMASILLEPVNFLSSPNLEKLERESDRVRPANLPDSTPITLNVNGASFRLTAIDTTTVFGGLDLDAAYAPDPSQAAELRDPPSARKQVTTVMSALLQLHPELQTAFHGIWVHANQGDSSLFALELPMSQITALPTPASASSSSSANPVSR